MAAIERLAAFHKIRNNTAFRLQRSTAESTFRMENHIEAQKVLCRTQKYRRKLMSTAEGISFSFFSQIQFANNSKRSTFLAAPSSFSFSTNLMDSHHDSVAVSRKLNFPKRTNCVFLVYLPSRKIWITGCQYACEIRSEIMPAIHLRCLMAWFEPNNVDAPIRPGKRNSTTAN